MPIKVGGQSTRALTYGTGRSGGGQRKYTLDLLEQQRRHRMRMQEYMASSMYRRLPEAEEGEWADPMAALGEEVQASRPPRRAGDLVPRSPRTATGSRGVPVRIGEQKRLNERARQADMPLPYPEAATGQALKTMQAQKRKNEAARRMAARQGRVLPDDKLPYPDVEPQFTSRREVEREQEVSDAALERSHREDMARQAQDAMAERQIEMEQRAELSAAKEKVREGLAHDERDIQEGWYPDDKDAKELRRINTIMRQLLTSDRFTPDNEAARDNVMRHYNRRREAIQARKKQPKTQDEQLIEDFGEEGAKRFRGKVTKDPSGKWYSPTGVPESDESRDAKAYADREKRIRDRERKSMEADGATDAPQFNSDAERKKWARDVEDRLDAVAPAGGAAPGKDLMSRAMDAAAKHNDPQAIEFLAGLAAKGDPKAIAFFRRKM